jgi:hypothetical protein
MKTKILSIQSPKNGSDNLKKIEMLTEKLSKYFKIKLKNLMEEKNYKQSHLIFDINSYWRTMEGFGVETESIVHKMEKYLIEKISKSRLGLVLDNIRNETDINININSINNLKDDGNISVKNSNKRTINLQNINRNYEYDNII